MAKIEVKCYKLNDNGQGVFKVGKNEASVNNLLPKETAIVDESVFQNFRKYKMVKVLKPSSIRVDPKCSIYNYCGGCHLLHMNYDSQISFKKDYVERAFSDNGLKEKVDEIIQTDKRIEYRNKMQVAYRYKDRNLVYGFYEEDTHRVIPLTNCIVQSKNQNEIAKIICGIMKEMHIAPYDEDRRTGVIRFVMIRESVRTKEILVTIVTNGDMFPGRNDFVKRLRYKCPYITSIVQNVNTRKTSIILGDEERVLYGNGYIIDELCGNKFKISTKTFYQVNSYQTELLYNKVVEYADLTGKEVVCDAYCGVGTIGMTLAKKAKYVIGVENNKQSVINARQNAFDNKITNIKFICDDATTFISDLAKDKEKFDVVVMDPPRIGSTDKFLNALMDISPNKIIYVSCEAKTLARDLKVLVSKYKIVKKCIVDMFVGTYHVETICLLVRI